MDFSEASYWCTKADLMMTDGAEVDRDSHHELLSCGRGQTKSMAILINQAKSQKKVLKQKCLQF
jgi:hypothetical protein